MFTCCLATVLDVSTHLLSSSRQCLGEHLVERNDGSNAVEHTAKHLHDGFRYGGRHYVEHVAPVAVEKLVHSGFCNMLRHIIALLFGTLLINQWLDIVSRPSVQRFVVATSVRGNYSARERLRCVRACLSRTYERFRSFEEYYPIRGHPEIVRCFLQHLISRRPHELPR